MRDATPLLRLYAAWRRRQLARRDPVAGQRHLLRRLLRAAAATRFGQDHGFGEIRSVADYQAHVPLRRYDEFWQTYWRPVFPQLVDCTWPGRIPYFALSSGTTTGITKYIPCTTAMLRANRLAALDLLTHHLTARPASRLLGGRNFMLGGSTALTELAPGVWSGDLSGIASRTVPRWARPFYFPPGDLETIGDWEEKIARLAPASLAADIRTIGGTPSWLLLFFERLAMIRPDSAGALAGLYPHLELLVHGGVSFTPYRGVFAGLLAGSRAETREVYPASEGFIAVADRGDGDGLRLIADGGLFYEFVPVDELDRPAPVRHWLGTAETGINYALVLSTCAGLWSYIIGDTVRLIDLHPPRLLVTGRTSYSLSAFGEHLIGEEIDNAVAAAAGTIGAGIADYAVGAVFPARSGTAGGHLFIVEFAGEMPADDRLARFRAAIDDRLSALNDDYRTHRAGDFGMQAPTVQAVPAGFFARWMKHRGKLGGQHKVPRVINDDALFQDLRDSADRT